MMYGSWDMKRGKQNFLSFRTSFCPLHPLPQEPTKSKVWKNERKACRYYHFTHVYRKWKWFLRYGAWRTDYFVTVNNFLPFYPLKTGKMKILKNEKKQQTLEISSFHTNVPKILIICYTVPKIQCVTDIIPVFCVGLFFALLPPKNPKHQNFRKMKKLPRDIIILHMFTTNNDHMMYTVPEIWCATDRRIDGQKKWHIEEVGAPPKSHSTIALKLNALFNIPVNFLTLGCFRLF